MDAARGVLPRLGVPEVELHARMSRGVAAIVDECSAHGSPNDQHWLSYVLHEPAGAHEGLMGEPERVGQRLPYFVAHPCAAAAGLSEAHVVALRWFTSPAFESLNGPLRALQASGRANAPHPFAATVAFLAEGLRRLRRPDAVGTGADTGSATSSTGAVNAASAAKPSQRLWRGMRNVTAPGAFVRMGGTELALLSCTSDLATAARFASSGASMLFLVNARSFMQRGASLRFLSCFPAEDEYCYPPCTFLRPTGRCQHVDLGLGSGLRCVVLEVAPYVGS